MKKYNEEISVSYCKSFGSDVLPKLLIHCIISQAVPDKLPLEIKFYSHQLMHFLIQICISLLSYVKIT